MSKNTGKVYWANSRLIDKTDLKPRRRYIVIYDNNSKVKVSKIRGINDNDKNKKRLYELDMNKYPSLTKPSGVDDYVYSHKANSNKPLLLNDKSIFDSDFDFKLTSHDTYNVIQHTKLKKKKKK